MLVLFTSWVMQSSDGFIFFITQVTKRYKTDYRHYITIQVKSDSQLMTLISLYFNE